MTYEMTEQEIIAAAKTNWLAWQGLKELHPELAAWMEWHGKDVLYLSACGKWYTRGYRNRFADHDIYRLRPDYKPKQPEAGWREYPVIASKGKYYVKDLGSCGGDVHLPNVLGRVGFGGVQFEGQASNEWAMQIACFIEQGMLYRYDGAEVSAKPAVPVKARFWESK